MVNIADIEVDGRARSGSTGRLFGACRPAIGLGARFRRPLCDESQAAGVSLLGGDVTRAATSQLRLRP